MVFEQHKSARTELEKLQAQASGVTLLTPEQVQSLTASLQVLTDEEKQLITAQQQEQQSLNWLTRQDELQQEASRRQQALQQALAEEEKAQPQLAALGLAQPARNLRPHWERIAEHSAALAHIRQQIEEVNTRLQSTMALRASIRHHAAKQSAELQQQQQSLNTVTGTRPLPSVEQRTGGLACAVLPTNQRSRASAAMAATVNPC